MINAKPSAGHRRQTTVTGVILIGLAILLALLLAPDAAGNATFRLSRPTDTWPAPNLVVPSGPFIYVIATILAFVGARQFMRGGARWALLSLGIGLALAVAAFLVWATAGKAFSLTGMLRKMRVVARWAFPVAVTISNFESTCFPCSETLKTR